MGFGQMVGDLGRATPGINSIKDQVQQRQMFQMQREAHQKQQAMSEIALNKAMMEQKEREEQQKFMDSGWDPQVDPAFEQIPPERKETYVGMLKKAGLINPQTGLGTQRQRQQAMNMISSNAQIFNVVSQDMINFSRMKLADISARLAKAREKGKPEEIAALEKQFQDQGETHNGLTGDVQKELIKFDMMKEIEKAQKNGQWDKLPQPVQMGLYMSAKSGDMASATKIIQGLQQQQSKTNNTSYQDKGVTEKGLPVFFDPDNAVRLVRVGGNVEQYDESRHGAMKKTPAAEVNVDVGGSSFKELGKEMGKQIVDQKKDVEQAAQSLMGLQDAEGFIDRGIISGTGAQYILNFGKALQQIGFNVGENEVANTEAFAALQGKQVGQIIKQFGAGTGLSDADREYAEKIAGGKITLNEKSLRKIIQINKKGLRNIIKNFNLKAEKVMSRPEAKDLPYDLRIDIDPNLMNDTKNPKDFKNKDKYGFVLGETRKASDGKTYTYIGNNQWER